MQGTSPKKPRRPRSKTICIHDSAFKSPRIVIAQSHTSKPARKQRSLSARSELRSEQDEWFVPKQHERFSPERREWFSPKQREWSTHATNSNSPVGLALPSIVESNMIRELNLSLMGDGSRYTLLEYIDIASTLFKDNVELRQMHLFTTRFTGVDFCIHEKELPGTINVNSVIKQFGFIEGVDFITSNEFYQSKWRLLDRYKVVKIFTPRSYKKMILYSGDMRIANYYTFMDEMVKGYAEYQLLIDHNRDVESSHVKSPLEHATQTLEYPMENSEYESRLSECEQDCSQSPDVTGMLFGNASFAHCTQSQTVKFSLYGN